MADDFERAILYSFDQGSGVHEELRRQAESYCRQVREDPGCWKACVARFPVTQYNEVRFWCLQTLQEVVRLRSVWQSGLSAEERQAFRRALLAWVGSCARHRGTAQGGGEAGEAAGLDEGAEVVAGGRWGGPPPPAYVRNKLAQLTAMTVRLDFPQGWPGFFDDLLGALGMDGGGGAPKDLLAAADMFERVLDSVDKDVINAPGADGGGGGGGGGGAGAGTRVKDGLRDAPERMERLLGAWYACTTGCSTLALDESVGELRRGAAAERGSGLLELLARYVEWIGLDLVVNERWVSLVFALAFPGSDMDPRGAAAPGAGRSEAERMLQCGALCVVQAVVTKGMDVRAKVQLIRQLQLPRLLPEYVRYALSEGGDSGSGGRGGGGGVDSGGDEEDGMEDGDGDEAPGYAVALASTATGVASELMGCVDKLGEEDGSGVATECGVMLGRVMPAVLDAVRAGRDEISAAALPFVVAYVRRLARMREKGELSEDLDAGSLASLGAILGVIRDKLRLAGDTAPGLTDAEDELALQEYRKELCVMLRNVVRLIPERSKLFVAGLIAPLLHGPGNRPSSPALRSMPWTEVEVSVGMLYELGEILTDEVLRPHFPLMGDRAQVERAISVEGSSAFLSTAVASGVDMSLCDLVVLVVGYSDIEHYGHRAVTRTYLELLNRYYRSFSRGSAKSATAPPVELLGRVLQAFVDGRGLKNDDSDIRSRASYLLMRLCKSLRSQLIPYADEMLSRLGEVMVMKGFYADAQRPMSGRRDSTGVGGSHRCSVDDRNSRSDLSLPGLLTPESQLHLFEAVGILVGLGQMPTEKQAHYLELILQPLMSSIDMCLKVGASRSGLLPPGGDAGLDPSYATIDTHALLQHLIAGAAFIAQGFGATLASDVTYGRGEMVRQTQLFKGMMELVLRVLEVEGRISDGVRDAAMSFLHRMVISLGIQVMPYMARVVDCLMGQSDPSVIKHYLLLVNQLCSTFKRDVAGMLEEIFLPVINGIFALLQPTGVGGAGGGLAGIDLVSWSSSQDGISVPPVLLVNETNSIDANGKQLANTEEVRELRELQRGYFAHLHTIFANSLSSVLLTERNIAAVQPIFASLVVAGAHAKDMGTRRVCLQICTHAMHDWMAAGLDRVGVVPNTGEVDALAGREHAQALLKLRPDLMQWLQQFIVEEVVPTCCVRATLDEAFDLGDAKTDTLLGEIAHTLVVVYKFCGADSLTHLGRDVLPSVGCPEVLANEFLAQVATQDVPSLKKFLATFVRKSHDRHRP